MLPHNRQFDHHPFNDYIISPHNPTHKLISSTQRNLSSNSVYYQQNAVSRKKLTVISRDNTKSEFRGDYLMSDNGSGFVSRGSTGFSPMRNNETSHTFLTHRNSQGSESLSNSRVYKSKLKRPISPTPALVTPTKALKLKKSMVSQNHQQSASQTSQQRSINNSVSRPKFQSNVTSPIKMQVQGHRRLVSNANEGQVLYNTHNPHDHNLQNLRRQMLSLLNVKIMQFQMKMKQQQDTIRFLQAKLGENSKKLKEKDMIIEQLNRTERSKTQHTVVQQTQRQKNVMQSNENTIDESYIAKRVKDIQTKYHLILNEQNNLQKAQQLLNKKLAIIESQLIKINFSRLNHLKVNLSNFLDQKLIQVTILSESISYLDNKLIGRTQALKETLSQIKHKIKQAQDSWTQKDTKGTKESTTIGKQDDYASHDNKNAHVCKIENKLRQVTSFDQIKDSPYKNLQCSLEFSLTSYDEETNRSLNHQNKHTKNVYYEQNLNEMDDVSIGLFGEGHKNDMSRLTDDFYYPGSTNNTSRMSSRNVSPIHPKKKANQYFGDPKQSSSSKRINLLKKQSPIAAKSPVKPCKSSPLQQSSHNVIKISNQQITKKIEMIQQMIENKKSTTCESIQKGQLRCYVDKTGYLKYTDSKTFVFDRKGNLIPCTQGEYWFLVTKGLIYGQRDDEQSRTVSFIEYDE